MPTTKKTKAPAYVQGTNCTGSGCSWLTGGKCPQCELTANQIQDRHDIQARRGDGSLYPHVPRHPASDNPAAPAPSSKQRAERTAASVRVKNQLAKPAPSPVPPSKRARALKAVPDPQPVKAAAATKPKPRATKDPLEKPFTQTIQDYLVWLEKQTGPFEELSPDRLAGLAITMYGRYQVSPERAAARQTK